MRRKFGKDQSESVTHSIEDSNTQILPEEPIIPNIVSGMELFENGVQQDAQPRLAKFVPPSQRQNIPKNLLVTTVEVGWRAGVGRQTQTEEVVDIPQVQAEEEQEMPLDWNEIGSRWNKYDVLDSISQISPKTLVAWKVRNPIHCCLSTLIIVQGFGLDPVTLTPQADVLHVASIISCDSEPLRVELLKRPDVGQVSFGRTMLEDDEPGEEMETSFGEACNGQWRIIKQIKII